MRLIATPIGMTIMDFIKMSTKVHLFSTYFAEITFIGFIINNTVEDESPDDDPSQKLWHIIKYYRNDETLDGFGYKLHKGDIIKLGRVRFKVLELHRGKYHPKGTEKQDIKPSEYNKLYASIGSKYSKMQHVKVNNFIKQASTLPKNLKSSKVS